MVINLKKTFEVLFIFFCLSTLLIPVSIINKICFVGIIIIAASNIISEKRLVTLSPFVVLSIFLYGFILSMFNHSEESLRNQFVLSVAVLFAIYPIMRYGLNLDKIFRICGLVLVAYSGMVFLALFWFQGSGPSGLLLDFFNVYSAGSIGERSFTDEGVFVFQLGSTPFIYISTTLYVEKFILEKKTKYLFALIPFIIAILFGGLRGLMVSCVLSTVFLIFYHSNIKYRLFYLTFGSLIMLGAISYVLNNTYIFDKNEESNNIKIGHAESFVENLTIDRFFIGEGLASFYYSKGKEKSVAHTEITPLDMARYFGVVFATFLYLALLIPKFNLSRYVRNIDSFAIFFIYLINSITNPVMFNSYGLLIVLWYWFRILNKNTSVDSNASPEQ